MANPVQNLLDQIASQAEHAFDSVESLQQDISAEPKRIRKLAESQTDAFVDLARHYVPELTQQTLTDAWSEVRHRIEDVLLRRNDQCDPLQKRLEQLRRERQQRIIELESHRQQHEKARLDLLSKRGNAQKVLSEDPEVTHTIEAIDRVDREIEFAISLQEDAREDAAEKLPEYESCSLFTYLRDRDFGTPNYRQTGLERRWDRWVAKFIDFKNAKASFDHLHQAPKSLQQLIDQKRDHYHELLSRLERARESAMDRFDVPAQAQLWGTLGQDTEQLQRQINEIETETSQVQSEWHSHDQRHYQEAIDVYHRFLVDLDPEILRVYAACTDSPVDDQICARIRKIKGEITRERTRADELRREIVDWHKYVAALNELAWRLQTRASATPIEIAHGDDFCFTTRLAELRDRATTPSDVWSELRRLMVRQMNLKTDRDDGHDVSGPGTKRDAMSDDTTSAPKGAAPNAPYRLIDSSFMAASCADPDLPARRRIDPLDIVLLSDSFSSSVGRQSLAGFRALACCPTKSDAIDLTSRLGEQGILSFLHSHRVDGPLSASGFDVLTESVVMVDPDRYHDARQFVTHLQSRVQQEWDCRPCEVSIDPGYNLCWKCGAWRH